MTAPCVNAAQFRAAIGAFTSGVAVVTTLEDGLPLGTTISAVCSVSLEPATLLICLNITSATGAAIDRTGHFAVNVLAAGQGDIAAHFAAPSSPFQQRLHGPGTRGAPLLHDALAVFECRVVHRVEVATHAVLFGEVEQLNVRAGEPLAYYRGQLHALAATSKDAGAEP